MRDRKGFTLIELLIVVVIIGILAAIAIPRFSSTRERAYVSAMKSDLRNLANQQELYYGVWFEYSGDEAALEWTRSNRVELVGAITATQTGWAATVTHPGMNANPNCYMSFGDQANPGAAAVPPGIVWCDGEPTDGFTVTP